MITNRSWAEKTLGAIILAGQLAGVGGKGEAQREKRWDAHPPGQAPLTARLDTVINVLPALHTRGHDAMIPRWLRAVETLRAGRGVAGRTLEARRAAACTGHANCKHDTNTHGSGGRRERQGL